MGLWYSGHFIQTKAVSISNMTVDDLLLLYQA